MTIPQNTVKNTLDDEETINQEDDECNYDISSELTGTTPSTGSSSARI